ncbi:MAG: hypothetical protein II979_04310, partial [Clostridia bacterium]|nr:hypothetical protein [Clostridia bacterium]
LVFGGSDTASSDQFKLNGTSTSINSSFIYTGSIAAGRRCCGDFIGDFFPCYADRDGCSGGEGYYLL